jgi:hypothetical protein
VATAIGWTLSVTAPVAFPAGACIRLRRGQVHKNRPMSAKAGQDRELLW